MPVDSRYLSNRNLWKKKTGTSKRQKPQVIELLDANTLETYTFDLTKVVRHRDPYQLKFGRSSTDPNSFVYGEYDEGVFSFVAGEDSYDLVFNTTFSGVPYVVLEQNPPGGSSAGLVNLAGGVLTDTGMTVYSSAEAQSGSTLSVRYRAVYSATYPCLVTSSFTGSFFAVVGGQYTPPSNTVTSFTSSLAISSLDSVTETRISPIQTNSTGSFTSHNELLNENAVNTAGTLNVSADLSSPVGSNTVFDYLVVL